MGKWLLHSEERGEKGSVIGTGHQCDFSTSAMESWENSLCCRGLLVSRVLWRGECLENEKSSFVNACFFC